MGKFDIFVIGLLMVIGSLMIMALFSEVQYADEKETENLRLINSFEEYDKQEYPVKEYNKPKFCSFKVLDEFKCNGDEIIQKYQISDCSYKWIYYRLCSYGCDDGMCIDKPIPEDTSSGIVCTYNYYNCSDFSTYREAREVFDYCKSQGQGDIHWLDGDDDGIPCEALW